MNDIPSLNKTDNFDNLNYNLQRSYPKNLIKNIILKSLQYIYSIYKRHLPQASLHLSISRLSWALQLAGHPVQPGIWTL